MQAHAHAHGTDARRCLGTDIGRRERWGREKERRTGSRGREEGWRDRAWGRGVIGGGKEERRGRSLYAVTCHVPSVVISNERVFHNGERFQVRRESLIKDP